MKVAGYRYQVYRLVQKALCSGELKRPESCQRCHTTAKVDAHHHDYAKPLDVHWLCRRCHWLETSNTKSKGKYSHRNYEKAGYPVWGPKRVYETVAHEKKCSRCKKVRPSQEFHRNKYRKDGLTGYCKPCTRAWREKENATMHRSLVRDAGRRAVALLKKGVSIDGVATILYGTATPKTIQRVRSVARHRGVTGLRIGSC